MLRRQFSRPVEEDDDQEEEGGGQDSDSSSECMYGEDSGNLNPLVLESDSDSSKEDQYM